MRPDAIGMADDARALEQDEDHVGREREPCQAQSDATRFVHRGKRDESGIGERAVGRLDSADEVEEQREHRDVDSPVDGEVARRKSRTRAREPIDSVE